jgi:hypothetical protein
MSSSNLKKCIDNNDTLIPVKPRPDNSFVYYCTSCRKRGSKLALLKRVCIPAPIGKICVLVEIIVADKKWIVCLHCPCFYLSFDSYTCHRSSKIMAGNYFKCSKSECKNCTYENIDTPIKLCIHNMCTVTYRLKHHMYTNMSLASAIENSSVFCSNGENDTLKYINHQNAIPYLKKQMKFLFLNTKI